MPKPIRAEPRIAKEAGSGAATPGVDTDPTTTFPVPLFCMPTVVDIAKVKWQTSPGQFAAVGVMVPVSIPFSQRSKASPDCAEPTVTSIAVNPVLVVSNTECPPVPPPISQFTSVQVLEPTVFSPRPDSLA